MIKTISNYILGTGVAHEVLESYVGGLNSQKSGKSAGTSIKDEKSYRKAHKDKRVLKQAGDLVNRFYDVNGKEVPQGSPDATEARQTFEKKRADPKTILDPVDQISISNYATFL